MIKKIIPILVVGFLVFSGVVMAGVTTVTYTETTLDNHPPNVPEIAGPTCPKIGVECNFIISTTDPDGDNVSYYIDWGDGTVTDWIGPYHSGIDVTLSHTWYKSGWYLVGYKAKDHPYEAESELGQHLIRVPPNSKVLACPFVSISTMPIAGSLSVEQALTKKQVCKFNSFNDTTPPIIEVTWEVNKTDDKWIVTFFVTCYDNESGIQRLETWLNYVLQDTIIGPGPIIYDFSFEWFKEIKKFVFKWIAYNFAGLSASVLVNGSDIKSYSSSQISQQSFSALNSQNIMSVVSSTDNFIKDIPIDCSPLESVYNLDEKFSHNTTWYMFIAGPAVVQGFYAFYPNGTYRFREWEGDDFFSGGTWTNDGRYLCCLYENGTLYDINPETLEACPIGNGGASLNGLAYNPVNGKLYGASSSDLYEININTGEQTHIGAFGIDTNAYMIDIAFDIDGICYGWDVKSSGESYLYKINTSTGEATIVGGMGVTLTYAQDGAFEYDTDILYLVAYTFNGGCLLECDEDTGECINLGQLLGEADALAISYDYTPPVTTISFDPPEPDGCNGWYVSNVTVMLNATDQDGVNATYYRINNETWEAYDSPFVILEEGYDILIEFYSVDIFGNIENVKSSTLDIDRTAPNMTVEWEVKRIGWRKWQVTFSINITNEPSGMNRIDIYINDILQETIVGDGPIYSWSIIICYVPKLTFKFLTWDQACNQAIVIVNGSDIKSYSSSQISQQSFSAPNSQNIMSVVSSADTTVVDKSYVSLLYTTHDPIYIHGNDEFTSENGVTGGSGTSSDPYVIEGWEINASSQDGVIIKNTSVFFEIKDCYVHGGGTTHDGIVFYNVTNGVIKNNIITRNRNGAIFRAQQDGWKEDSSYNKIQQNTISNNTFDGIHFEHIMNGHHSYNQIFLNNITGNDNEGIYLIMSKENLIYCNNIISNSEFGVELFTCTGGGTNNKVYHNNFIENGGENGQASCTCDCNDWDDGYPSGGNFWSDYTGSDNNGDGIGDEPYMIFSDYENDYDWYPLMEPYNWTIPFAKFTWIPPLPEPNETILFNASESVDYDGNITLYEWDWDDDGEYDENYTSPTATHTFEEIGYYPVTLRVTDNDNLTDNMTKTVRVGNQPPYEPSNPYPEDGATNVPIDVILRWKCSDPDGDRVTFDVYFGTTSPLPKVVSNWSKHSYDPGTLDFNTTYYWKIVAWDYYGASTEGPIWNFTTRGNRPPNAPIITGKTNGKVGVEYQYNFTLSDPDNDAMYLRVDWGNGTSSPWQGPYDSGKTVKLNHIWSQKGTYTIRAQAKDIYGVESDWGTLTVKMPKNQQNSQQSSNLLFFQIVKRMLNTR